MCSGFGAATGVSVETVGRVAVYISRAVAKHTVASIVQVSGVLVASNSSASAAWSTTRFTGSCTF